MKIIFAIVILLILAATLQAQTINQNIGGGIGYTFDGGINGKGKGGSAPIAPCGTGVINLTTGCTQPMLGGL
jgi:hypothetical protein